MSELLPQAEAKDMKLAPTMQPVVANEKTAQSLKIQGLGGFSCVIFPYVFPLQVQNVLDEVLHSGGAVLRHALGEVAVAVQSKGSGGVA